MSATETLPTVPDASHDDFLAEYIEKQSTRSENRDGSATSPQRTMAVMLLSREGRSQTAISQILGMDARTVKAILARQDSIIADGRMLLKANTLGFVGDAIVASQEAAKRGKLEGISAMLDRLGVTEPPKSQAQTNVGVQVVLHGGPEPVSLAKVDVQSEGVKNQAENTTGLISHLMDTSNSLERKDLQALSVAQPEPTGDAR